MKTLFDIQSDLANSLASITPANGYTNNLPANRIYLRYSDELAERLDDQAYPRVFVLAQDRSYATGPGRTEHGLANFRVSIFVRATSSTTDSITPLLASLSADIERWNRNDNRIGGNATEVKLLQSHTDSGALYPEGVVTFDMQVRWDA